MKQKEADLRRCRQLCYRPLSKQQTPPNMSACSSQLSPSLLGGATADADSASTTHLTKQRQPRSASAGMLHASAHLIGGSRSSRRAAGSTSQPKQRSDSRAVSTPASPQSPVFPAESVASQGHHAACTPQSSASTSQSHASSGSGISNKPRWQQSTVASSRSQRNSHPSSKQSFLTRLQAQAGQAAPDKQQQHDAKAAEMKAKLQEWRQQQKQQKQQQQQQRLAQKQGPSDGSGRLMMPAKKPLLQQPGLAGPTGKPTSASVDSV